MKLPKKKPSFLFLTCTAVMAFLFLYFFVPPARSTTHVVLKKIEIKEMPRFIRLRFLFKKNFPDKIGSYQRGKALTLLFRGTTNGLSKNVIHVKSKGIVRDIRILRYKRGMRIVINLKDPNVEFVRYQRRSPPQVVVSLREAKHPKKQTTRVAKTSPPPKKTTPKKVPPKAPPVKKELPPPVEKTPKKPVEKQAKTTKEKTRQEKTVPPKEEKVERVAKIEPEELKKVTLPPIQKEEKQEKKSYLSLSSLPPSKNPQIAALFSKAEKDFSDGNYRHAAKKFQTIMKEAPNTREGEAAAYYWAKSLYLQREKKKILEAPKAYEEILKEYSEAPWRYEALKDLMFLYASLKQYSLAIKICQEVIKQYPHSPRAESALFHMGKFQLLTHNYTQAISILQTYLKRYPKGSYVREATFSLGDAFYFNGNIQKAADIYQLALRRWPLTTPTEVKNLVNIAMTLEKSGQADRGLDLLFDALNISATEEEKPFLMLNIASLYVREKRIREALVVYSKIKAQYPGTQEAALSIKELSRLSRKYPKAKSEGF